MDKKSQFLAKIRLIAYAVVIGAFAISGITLFIIAQFQRAKYSDAKVQLSDAQTNLETLKTQPESYQNGKKIEYYTDLENFFTKETRVTSTNYKTFSIVSYSLTMMALVSFGVCLKVEDFFKSKEEK